MRVPSLIVLAGCSIIQLSAQSEKPNAAVLPCVQSLQSAAALNDWNPKQLATLTESCVSEGRAADAEKILLALHDTTSGLHRRLQLLELLEWTATSAGDLPKLKELFAARHEGDRALALLELSELGASPSSYPERRKLLTQVAGLAAENAELLVEIQDRQEAEGYWTDALATAES